MAANNSPGSSFRFLGDARSVVTDTGQKEGAAAIPAMPLSVAAPAGGGGGWTSVVMDGIISVAAGKDGGMGVAPNCSSSNSTSDAVIGLELGKRTYFEVPAIAAAPTAGGGGGGGGSCSSNSSAAHAPPPPPSLPPLQPPLPNPKRPRVAGQTPKCQVEGCKADLSSAKEYHRRHKVCAAHSKSARVIVAAQEQRFCQQCSRFHGLAEFDEGKRSCRRRLAGHNERRRKPQPDPLGLNARFLPPPFQDCRKLGHLCGDRPSFLSHPRISAAAPWDEYNAATQKGGWMLDQSTLDSMTMAAANERQQQQQQQQLFLAGLQQQQSTTNCSDNNNNRPSPFSPQSPKGMIPVVSVSASADANHSHQHHHHQYFLHHHHHHQGSADPLRHHHHHHHQQRSSSLAVVSSSSSSSSSSSAAAGAGVVHSGLEAIPIIGQGFARVSDSGRALSLQSNIQQQQQLPSSSSSSSSSPAAVSLDVATAHHLQPQQQQHRSSLMPPDQNLQHGSHIPVAQPLAQAAASTHPPPQHQHQHQHQHHHQFEWMGDKLFSAPPPSSLQQHTLSSSSAGFTADSSCALDKNQIQRPQFMPSSSINGVGGGNFDCVPLYSMLHGEVRLGDMAQDAKPTIDLMQMATATHNNQGSGTSSLVTSGGYEIGMSAFADLQALRSFGSSSIFSSQQM